MSELSKLTKKFEEFEKQLSSISNQPSSIEKEVFHNFQVLKSYQGYINDYFIPTIQKLKSKKDVKDSITGASRYGPNYISKLDDLFLKIIQTNENCSSLVANYELYIQNKFPSPRDSSMDDGLAVTEMKYQISPIIQNNSEELQKEAETMRLAQQELDILHQKAEESRLKRLEEARIRAEKSNHKLESIKEEIKKLNEKKKGLTELPVVINQIKSSQHNQSAIKNLLSIVYDMLTSIIKNPDKESLRKLRIDHPVIWEKVGKHLNGLHVLLVIGFELRLETKLLLTENPIHINDDVAHDSSESVRDQMSEATHLIQQLKDINVDGISHKLIMVMNEPDINSIGPNNWIAWFDGLQGMRSYLESEIS